MIIKKLTAVVVSAAALYTPFLLKDSGNCFLGDCDYLIILGYKLKENKPDVQLIERINAAADYLKNHKKTFAVAVGGIAHGNTVSEAQVIKENLISLGVEENRILTEEKSKTTFENFKFVCEIIGEHSHKNIEDLTVCLLTSDCHIHRSLMFAKSAGLKNVHSIAVRTHSKRFYSYLREYPLAVDAFFRCAVNKIKKG